MSRRRTLMGRKSKNLCPYSNGTEFYQASTSTQYYRQIAFSGLNTSSLYTFSATLDGTYSDNGRAYIIGSQKNQFFALSGRGRNYASDYPASNGTITLNIRTPYLQEQPNSITQIMLCEGTDTEYEPY